MQVNLMRVRSGGAVTGSGPFVRSIGPAVGVSIFGGIANSIFNGQFVEETRRSLLEAGSAAVFVAIVVAAGVYAGGCTCYA